VNALNDALWRNNQRRARRSFAGDDAKQSITR